MLRVKAEHVSHLQARCCRRKFEFGSLLRILPKITSLHGDIITMELLRGLPRIVSSRTGRRRVPSCGCMVNVCDHPAFLLAISDACLCCICIAGSGKSILWYVPYQFRYLSLSSYQPAQQSSKNSTPCAKLD
jgi:hypothetical protein